MDVISTRGPARISALRAVLDGIAPDGGLFVPLELPRMSLADVQADFRSGYAILAARVLGQFFDLSWSELTAMTAAGYARFAVPTIVPVRDLGASLRVMELFHGPTLAFKDMALQILPRLMAHALARSGRADDALILTATSGDTGKAALEGFRDAPRAAVLVFYPDDGVAEMQRLQMATQEGANVGVCAVAGNFDDAQTGVKNLFADRDFGRAAAGAGYFLSSANSINIGRLIPQIAYYAHAYAHLVADGTLQPGETVNFVVPTGNFGNILAAHYARRMGLPIGKLICASNRNNVLTDFFRRGSYDARREFHKTMSPSMDILVSSNLERLLYEISGRDPAAVRTWMEGLAADGGYNIPAAARESLAGEFHADFADEEETAGEIRRVWREKQYLMDPHTAVGSAVHRKYVRDTGDHTPTILAATASPYKFTPDVLRALTGEALEDAFAAAGRLSALTGSPVPPAIARLRELPELHRGTARKDGLAGAALDFLRRMRG